MWSSTFLCMFIFAFCQTTTTLGQGLSDHDESSYNIFHDPQFWQHFEKEVRSNAWSCNFKSDVLQNSLEKDAALYNDDTVFRRRRQGAEQWIANTTLWVETVLGACKELSDGESGKYTRQLKGLNMLDAFADYMDHLNFFQMVANKMSSLGEQVKPFSQDSSGIHDIDKLDPIMIVGYSERFEDNMTTSVWDLCVNRHTKVNPHHQAHCFWHGCCEDRDESCTFCEDLKKSALREMVCDKVSRRVQKNLGGKMTRDMWNVDISFFAGLPEDWLERAKNMMQDLKGNDTETQ